MEKSKGALSITSLAPLRTTGTFNLNDVQGVYPNATSRKFLAEEWRRLSPDDQLILRAARSKRGWRCDICGSNGYFREICPNQCTSPPSTPDSLASSAPPTPPHDTCSQSITIKSKESTGTGVFWGQKKFKGFRGRKKKDPNEPVTTSHLNEKVDLTTLRPDAMHKLEELRTSDENLKHSYYLNSDEMYSRNYAELTLQQVMRRMIRLLEKELKATIAELTASFDTSLLHPPKRVIQSTFYPKELMKFPEFREYFLKKESEVKNNNYYYKHQSSVRPVDDLDSLFRGPANSSNELFIRKSNAGESVHSKNTWKSVLSKNDLLASSDPLLAKKQADLDNMFANQSKWISLQQTSMQYQNERFEHLLFLVHNEIEKEHAREADLLSAKTKRSEKDVAMRLWQERSHSVDLLLAILQSYQFTAGLEEADFLLFCFERWQKQNKSFGSSSSSSKKSILYNKSQNTDSITSNNIMDGEDENDNIDQPNERPTKNSAKFKATKQPNAMISAMTNPYYHDVQFVQKVKKKREKLFEMGKTGRAMTAAEQREALKEKQLEQMKMLQALENGGSLKDQGAPALVQEDENNGEVSVPSSPTRRKTVQISEQFNYSHDSYDDPTVGGGQQHSFSLQRSFTNISNKSGTSTCTHNSSPSKSILPPSLPDLSDIINQAKQHQTEINEQKQRTWEQRNVVNTLASGAHETSTTGKEVLHRKPYIHPKDLDTMHIAKVKKAFKMAGLGNRIRKGNDDDFAMALPALIPIPKAFDGNSSMVSHTANQIVFQLKRDMVLSDIGKLISLLILYLSYIIPLLPQAIHHKQSCLYTSAIPYMKRKALPKWATQRRKSWLWIVAILTMWADQ